MVDRCWIYALFIWNTNDMFYIFKWWDRMEKKSRVRHDCDRWWLTCGNEALICLLSRTCCLTTSGPGAFPVSGVGGLLTSVCVCVSRPSGLKPLLNTHPHNDTDTVPSRAPWSPDCVPGKHNLYRVAPPLWISLHLLYFSFSSLSPNSCV